MTNTSEFVGRVETDLQANRKIGAASKAAFGSLPAESRAAFQQMMAWVGADCGFLDRSFDRAEMADRVEAASLMFLQFAIETHEPAWSSWLLEKMLEAVLKTPKGEATDLIRGLDRALKRYHVRLTQTVANLVRDVVILTFNKAGGSYQSADWDWANEELKAGASPAQCYLFLYALPPDKLQASSVAAILRNLANTSFAKEAVVNLSDDLERPEVKPLLQGLKLPQFQTK